MGFFRQVYLSGLPFPSPGDLPNPGIEPRSPALQADSLPSELQGKSPISDRWGSNVLATSVTRGKSRLRLSFLICKTGNNTGVSCHFLLQGIFPTQESNPGLLHCRQILYRLNYQEEATPIAKC